MRQCIYEVAAGSWHACQGGMGRRHGWVSVTQVGLRVGEVPPVGGRKREEEREAGQAGKGGAARPAWANQVGPRGRGKTKGRVS
jgi:hypothetical protein